MMNQKLKAIASFVSKDDTVLDTCCDHAYLAIYLKKNKLCKEVYASDINPNALAVAKKNIAGAKLEIKTYLSDGLKTVDNKDIDTVVIAGVGADTVLDIIRSAPSSIKKYIISSNNHLAYLRHKLRKYNLYIQEEVAVLDKHKYYVVMLVTKDYVKDNRNTIRFGKSKNVEYFRHLIKKEEEVVDRIPKNKVFRRFRHKQNIKTLQKLIKRI